MATIIASRRSLRRGTAEVTGIHPYIDLHKKKRTGTIAFAETWFLL
jgi:hypothetical protein